MAIVKIDIKTDMHGSTGKVEGFDKALGGMRGSATNGTKALKGMWKQMAAGIGVTAGVTLAVKAVVGQVKDMFRVGREFEREWANVTTMLTISKEATGKMRDELLGLSPTLGDTTDLAAGMYQVLSASIEPAKAIKFLGEAAKSAKAGVTETKVAVDALTTVINAYGMEAEDVTEISDIMFGVVKRGKLTYDEMAASLGTIVPVAAQLGIGFKDIGAAMATMTRKGIDAQTATMQLRQVLMSVLGASDKVKKMAKDMGFEFTAAALKTKGLSKFLDDLQEGTKGNNEILREFVTNVRALSGVMALGGEGARGYADDIEFLGEVIGLTDEAFEKQMDSMDFWIKTADVVLDKFKTSFYGGFVTPLKDGITSSDELDTATNELMDTFKELGQFIGTSFKTAFDSLIRNYESSKRAAALIQIVTEGLTLAIKSKQIPTLKNVLKLWAEHQIELMKNREVLEHLAKWTTLTAEKTEKAGEATREYTLSIEEMKARVAEIEYKMAIKKLGEYIDNIKMADKEIINFGDDVEITALDLIGNMDVLASSWGFSAGQIIKVTKEMTEAQIAFAATMLGEFMAMEATLKGFVNAIMSNFERWAIGQIIPKIMAALPFPANLLATGGAILAIKSLFAGIKLMKEGAVFDKPTFVQAVMGEGGETEVLAPESKLKEIFREVTIEKATPAFKEGPQVTVIQNNYFKNLDQYSIRQAGAMLHAEVVRQKTRFGAK